jgi:hypothetical protein
LSEIRQYLDLSDNPNGYCPVNATGVACPIGTGIRLGEAAEKLQIV